MRGSQIRSIGKIKLKRIFLIILSVIVLLAGAGHVRKGAIPRQIGNLQELPMQLSCR